MKIKAGQEWIMNRPGKTPSTLHVLGIQTDMLGKHKIAVQEELPLRSEWARRHFMTAKLVSPSYFYGLTVKVVKGKK